MSGLPQIPGFDASNLARGVMQMHLPRWEELPEIELYVDQMVGYINSAYAPAIDDSELPLTKSMVNNYVKQKILPPPSNKKYQRQHIALLILIYALKKVFSLPECVALLRLVAPGGQLRPGDYNQSCTALEQAVQLVFQNQESMPDGIPGLFQRSAMVWAGKVYLQKYLAYSARFQK